MIVPAAFLLMLFRGSPNKISRSSKSIGKGRLFACLAPPDILQIPSACAGKLRLMGTKNRRIEFSKSIITQKIEASILTLEKSIPRSEKRELAMEAAYFGLGRLDENCPKSPLEIMALEANCAAAYFRSWVGIPINWRGTKRRPIPESWRQIGARSSPFQMTGNHNAAHPVNAMLNYAYAVLESQIRIKAISEGYDPTLGILHHGRDKSSKFVFDLMEPERPKVDQRILEFLKNNVFDPADFTIRSDGVCRLNPELARTLVNIARLTGID